MASAPVIRLLSAALGGASHVRLCISGLDDLERLRAVWASSGAVVQRRGERLHATTTVQALVRAVGRAFGADAAEEVARRVHDVLEAWAGPAPALRAGATRLAADVRPLVVGVVNVTPDSFSDGGVLYPHRHPDAAIEHGRRLLAEGADLLDVGGESSRPGAEAVDEDEELARVVPVVRALAADAAVSIDTTKGGVAEAAVDAGACVVNDVGGGRDPALLKVVAERGAGYVLMHTRGTPRDMQQLTDYDDVVAEVYEYLAEGLDRCVAAGVELDQIAVDPGIGFAKTAAQNLTLLRDLRQLRGLGRPVLVGASRKSFLGAVLDTGPDDRLEASLACAAVAVAEGAALLRVHDVAATVRVARVTRAIRTGDPDWPPGWSAPA